MLNQNFDQIHHNTREITRQKDAELTKMCIDARRDMEEKLRKERDSQKAALEAAAARFATSLWSSISMTLSGLQCPHQYQCPPDFHSSCWQGEGGCTCSAHCEQGKGG